MNVQKGVSCHTEISQNGYDKCKIEQLLVLENPWNSIDFHGIPHKMWTMWPKEKQNTSDILCDWLTVAVKS